ncbi:Cytochrome P450 [Mycena venus]|uniref:Cytochrome P450 n=1 Tax=Mycena venus TaxID=2733690 RepID=A0A8H6X2C5_9AGAR|nr:Cytochrome P450 [Mycena venus]
MLLYLVCVFTAILLLYLGHRSRKNLLPLPPGPRRLPLIGHLLAMPSSYEWETYMTWSQQYSKASLARPDLQINAVTRPPMPMVNELMGWDFHFGFIKYGERWRNLRRLFYQTFNPTAVMEQYPKEHAACHELLRRLVRDPENFVHHLRHMTGGVILWTAYGIVVRPENDPHVKRAEDALRAMAHAIIPGRFLVDSIPALKYLPEWFPGAGFKRLAREWRELSELMIDAPFDEVKRNMAAGTAPISFTSTQLGNIRHPDEERAVKEVAGAMYVSGVDTTMSTISYFVLAMLSNPDAQRKAQEEIDSVVGDGRLPTSADEALLPYVSSLVKEVFRWIPSGPVEAEDEYHGYRIPAKSIVMVNVWAIFHDETTYPDSHSFRPERWLLDGKPNLAMGSPLDAAFGVCPGKQFAYSLVWITIASILATFDITKAVDENGDIIEPTYEYLSAMVTQPLPFKCSITPRSAEAERLISETILVENA